MNLTNRYWDGILEARPELRRMPLWREYNRDIHETLLTGWMPPAPVDRLLKTDAFDEALGAGLAGWLCARARWAGGVDLSPGILKNAAVRNRSRRLDMVAADVRRLPFADGTLDVIVSNSTLDHFGSPQDIAVALGECHRALRDGGSLLLTLDNPCNPLLALRRLLPFGLLNRVGILPYYVGASCPPFALRRLLERSGFRVSAMTAMMHCPRVLAIPLSRFVQRFTGRRARRRFLSLLKACESLAGLPTTYLSGHFVAVLAEKRRRAA